MQNELTIAGLMILGFFAIVSADPGRDKRRMLGSVITAVIMGVVLLTACHGS